MRTLASRSARPLAVALILVMLVATPRSPASRRSARARAPSTSWPGPATSSAARPTRTSTGSPTSRRRRGCKVRVKTANTSDEMVALMNEGGFDLVTASGDASLRLIAGGRVQEVNVALVPSYKTVDSRLQKAPWHHVKGKHYGVPYQWGYNVLAYNTEVFKTTPPKSWEVVFKETTLPDGKSNKGRVQAFDGPIYIADAALYLMHAKPELGIKNPYELDDKQYKAALELLREQRKIVVPLLARRVRPDRRLHQRGRGGLVLVGLPGEPAQGEEPADRQRRAAGGRHRVGRHDDDARPGPPSELRLHVARALRQPEAAGGPAAWFGSVPAVPAACKGNPLLGDEGCEQNGFKRVRPHLVLAHARRRLRRRPHLCAVLPLGDRLHRHPRRPLRGTSVPAGGDPPPAGARMAGATVPAVRFVGVCRSFGDVRAIDRVSFEVEDGEFFSLLGPSGSGKTTCLRLIAGFEQPDAGEILIHGAERRRRAALRARRQHRLPGLRALPAHDGRRQRGVQPHDPEGAGRRAAPPRRRDAGAGEARRARRAGSPASSRAASGSAWRSRGR